MRTISLRSSFVTLMAVTVVAMGCGDSGSNTGGGPAGGSPPSGGEGPQGGTPPVGGGEGPVGGNPTPVIDCIDVEAGKACTDADPIACVCAGCNLDACTDGATFDDCVCPSCNADAFCLDPANCNGDGVCDPYNEGCLCADCAEHPSCASGWIEICDNDADDNGNGAADCADPQCAAEAACQEICDNTTDENGNGDIDCADAQCVDFPACLTAACATPGIATTAAPTTGTTVGDTLIFESSCAGPASGDVYTFTPVTTGTLTITLASPDADLGFSVRTDCDDTATEVACEDAVAAGTDETGTVAVTAATPITIIVSGFNPNEEGPYTLTLALP
jgi:hypothetical protein